MRPLAAVLLLAGLNAACGGGDPLPGDPSAAFVPTPDRSARVASVPDGETLVLDGGQRVRLLGVDAPEGQETCVDESRGRLAALTLGRTVDLEVCTPPPPGHGVTSGTVAGWVVVPGESFVNLEMLRSGLAQVRGVGACGGEAAQARLAQGQAEAVAAERGVFGTDACRLPPPPPEPIARPTPTPSPPATPRPPVADRPAPPRDEERAERPPADNRGPGNADDRDDDDDDDDDDDGDRRGRRGGRG